MKLKTGILACASMMAFAAAAFTTASVPQNGVYRFTFGASVWQSGLTLLARTRADRGEPQADSEEAYGGEVKGKDVAGNLAIAVWSAVSGASAVRVHDVRETAQSLRVVEAISRFERLRQI